MNDKKNDYLLILLRNGIFFKKICSRRSYDSIFNNYLKELKKSEKVIFPKKYLNNKTDNGKINFEILCLSKNPLNNTVGTFFYKNIEWHIVKRNDYNIEEKFKIYNLKGRYTIVEIWNMFFAYKVDYYITIISFLNKLIIDRMDFDHKNNLKPFEVILCKNEEVSLLLQLCLQKIVKKANLTNYLFLGASSFTNRKIYRDKLVEHTNLKIRETYRLNS